MRSTLSHAVTAHSSRVEALINAPGVLLLLKFLGFKENEDKLWIEPGFDAALFTTVRNALALEVDPTAPPTAPPATPPAAPPAAPSVTPPAAAPAVPPAMPSAVQHTVPCAAPPAARTVPAASQPATPPVAPPTAPPAAPRAASAVALPADSREWLQARVKELFGEEILRFGLLRVRMRSSTVASAKPASSGLCLWVWAGDFCQRFSEPVWALREKSLALTEVVLTLTLSPSLVPHRQISPLSGYWS